MLDQLESFDFRNVQCTLETDRVVLRRQVVELFEEDLEPGWDPTEMSDAEIDSFLGSLSPTSPASQTSPASDKDELLMTEYPTKKM